MQRRLLLYKCPCQVNEHEAMCKYHGFTEICKTEGKRNTEQRAERIGLVEPKLSAWKLS